MERLILYLIGLTLLLGCQINIGNTNPSTGRYDGEYMVSMQILEGRCTPPANFEVNIVNYNVSGAVNLNQTDKLNMVGSIDRDGEKISVNLFYSDEGQRGTAIAILDTNNSRV